MFLTQVEIEGLQARTESAWEYTATMDPDLVEEAISPQTPHSALPSCSSGLPHLQEDGLWDLDIDDPELRRQEAQKAEEARAQIAMMKAAVLPPSPPLLSSLA